MPENTIVVSRPSKWGNPFPVGSSCPLLKTEITLDESLRRYAGLILGILSCDCPARRELIQLRGKNLACWCPLDQRCHADVLLRAVNLNESELRTLRLNDLADLLIGESVEG